MSGVIYVLVLTVGYGGNVMISLAVVPERFPDADSCEVAGRQFLKDMSKDGPRFTCLPVPKR